MKKMIPDDMKLVPKEAKKVFSGIIYDVYHWQQEMFDGSFGTFEMLRRTDTVQAICIDNGKIVIINEQQPGLSPKVNFPGGRVDSEDTSMLAAVQREVKEEVGMEFSDWRLIEVVQPHHKIEWCIYTYLATGKTAQSSPSLDVGEKISVSTKSFDQVKQLIKDNVAHVSEAQSLFEGLSSLEDLLHLPDFQGKLVDR